MTKESENLYTDAGTPKNTAVETATPMPVVDPAGSSAPSDGNGPASQVYVFKPASEAELRRMKFEQNVSIAFQIGSLVLVAIAIWQLIRKKGK